MHSRSLLIAILLTANTAYAGTVTWTGTCGGAPVNGSVYFRLANSGNDTAYNVALTPRLLDAKASDSSYSIGSVSGGSGNTIYIKLSSITGMGTYADYFILNYEQDSSSFAAVFPCMLTLGNASTVSSLNVSAQTSTSGNGLATIYVHVTNPSPTPISANVSIVLPPTFTFVSNRSVMLSLGPAASQSFAFAVEPPAGSSGSYAGAVAANYKVGNLSYGSLKTFLINKQSQSDMTLSPMLIAEILIAVAALALLALIARLAIRRAKSQGV